MFDPFVLPFTIGLSFTAFWFLFMLGRWFFGLTVKDRRVVLRGMTTIKTFEAIWETLSESLLHRKIWKRNFRLGYMHMSLAFGWFLLILVGHVESTVGSGSFSKPLYISVFWRFFEPGPVFPEAVFSMGFAFWMDFLLLIVLSGLAFAWIKRARSSVVGMKNTTQQHPVDRLALTALWLIFPARLIAESMTCGVHGTGSFLTGTTGFILSRLTDVTPWVAPAWWLYSSVLGLFFIVMPFSRYAHIPSEPVLIFFRRYGVRMGAQSPGYASLNLHACSSCGVCIDACQLADSMPGHRMQSAYFIQSVRRGAEAAGQGDCLACGRCESACPVGVELMPLRLEQKTVYSGIEIPKPEMKRVKSTGFNVVYFAGCMTHQTPGIVKSMEAIFAEAGAKWTMLDRESQLCCGRPLQLAGQKEAAIKVKVALQDMIIAQKATLLVTSCPICYRIFSKDYNLPGMRVLHHSQYISELIEWNRLKGGRSGLKAAYHEPCELGRGAGVHLEPRKILTQFYSSDVTPEMEGLCCGGSLGATTLDIATRKAVARGAVMQLTTNQPDVLLTACPLCRKTLSKVSVTPVMDIAEAVAGFLIPGSAIPEKKPAAEKTHRIRVAAGSDKR